MKIALITSLVCSTVLLSACDFSKKKNEASATEKLQDWSCTAPANIEQIQGHLKEDYLKEVDQRIRQSGYEADQKLLETIRKSIKFEINHISTKTENPDQAKTLECNSLIVAILPKGLQKRAENAYLTEPCEECEREDIRASSTYTLQDSIQNDWGTLTLKDDKISGVDFKYGLERSDNNEISMTVESNNIVNFAAKVTELAVNFEAYEKISKADREAVQKYDEEYNKENAAQMALAQKALDIRQKELDGEQKSAVERLNTTWDNLTAEQKEGLQQDQSDWFEKRDVDCKVLAQKKVHSLNESEMETYQKQRNYWDDAMEKQNEAMQYSKCFVQKTKERAVYLSNLFN